MDLTNDEISLIGNDKTNHLETRLKMTTNGWAEARLVAARPDKSSEIKVADSLISFIFQNSGVGSSYTFPRTDGTAYQVLATDGSGNLGWSSAAARADSTGDSWKDDAANERVYLPYKANGTARSLDSTVVIKDNGYTGIGLANPAGVLDIKGKMYVNNQQTIYNAGALNSGARGSLFVGNGGQNLDTANISPYEEADNNVGVGLDALLRVTSGEGNTAIGVSSLAANTSGRLNTATGASALPANTTGTGNSGYGVNAMYSNTSGDYNTGLGSLSLFSNSAGSSNTAIGYAALSRNTANGNTAAGRNAGWSISTGVNNTVVGYYVNQINRIITTGAYNTIMGYNTGIGITTGANNTILGSRVTIPATDSAMSNNIILADGAGNQRIRVLDNGMTGIGTSAPTSALQVYGAIATPIVSSGGVAITLNETHSLVMLTGSSSYTVTLPDPTSCRGRMYHLKNNTTTAKTTSPSYYDNSAATSTSIPANTVLHLVSDGVAWQQF